MKEFGCLTVYLNFLIFVLCVSCEDVTYNEDIPVVEGMGGKIKILEEDDVLVLTKETFNHVIYTRKFILVEFYAPWCGHCKSLAPEYAKAAKKLREEGIPLAKVDATQDSELGKQYAVTSYPTILLFKDGEKSDEYDGARVAEAIIDYMHERTDPNWKPPLSVIKVLTAENFTSVTTAEPLILVEFYAPWCGHCKRLEPEYEAAGRMLADYGIPLAKVDGTVETQVVDRLNIRGWPTLKVFRSGRMFEYKGPREQKGIVDYMKEEAKLPSKELLSDTDSRNSLSRTTPVVVGIFSGPSTFMDEYIAAGNEMRGVLPFFHSTASEVSSYFGISPNSVAVLLPEVYHSQYEKPKYIFSNDTGIAEDVVRFIKKHSVPLVGHRTRSNQATIYTMRPLAIVYYMVDFGFKYIQDTQYVRAKVLPVANELKNEITFAVSDEDEFSDEIQQLGLDDSGNDVVAAVFTEKLRYRMDPDEEFSTETLREFVTDVLSGKVKPHIRSQPIPRRQEGPVRIVVGRTFQKEIMESKRDVLVEIYAPWCGHCQKLEPIYNKLAKKMKTELPNLVVAKIDGTVNDVPPEFSVSGYPTIYFVQSIPDKKPLLYSGDRTLKAIRAFVLEHASAPPAHPDNKDEL